MRPTITSENMLIVLAIFSSVMDGRLIFGVASSGLDHFLPPGKIIGRWRGVRGSDERLSCNEGLYSRINF